jgi:hypothetical protein
MLGKIFNDNHAAPAQESRQTGGVEKMHKRKTAQT